MLAHRTRRIRIAAFLLIFIFPAFGRTGRREIWCESRIAGSTAGIYHEVLDPADDGNVVTTIENRVIFNRMGRKIEIKSESRSVETASGRLVSIDTVMSSSEQSTTVHVDVEPDSLRVRTSTGGKSYDRTVPAGGAVIGPEAARRLLLARLKAPGDTISYQIFVPELGSVTTITQKLIETGKVEATMSAMPGKTMMWVDASGWLVRQVSPSPFGDIETAVSSPDKLAKHSDEGATLPAESFRGTLVTSNIRLPEERLIEQMKIRITHKKPELGWPDFSAENQKVIEATPDHVVLEMQRSTQPDAKLPVVPVNDSLKPYVAPNALLQSDDPQVKQLAATIVGDEPGVWSAARKLQRWTNQNMRFDMGIAIAPASEVARNRRGTCFGYAMLLASLARAAGIPSRIRMGYVYAGGIWGGHAWVDVRIGGDWVSLDGALYSPGPADAARISFFTSALEEGAIAGMGSLAQLYGNVDIEILEYTVGGKRVTVPRDAKPFLISGNTYRNPWLGLTVTKPDSFRFTTIDAVWPDTTVVAMSGPRGESVEIEGRSASLELSPEALEDVVFRKSVGAAGMVVASGGDVYFIKAACADAKQVLTQVLAGFKIDR
jgi:hypothetical protein